MGYLLVGLLDGAAHLEQVSVHPSRTRQGLGRRLLETAVLRAEQQSLSAVTLTTFADVPWNAPYYQRLGFQTLAESELTEGLRRIVKHEAARVLNVWPRVSMRRTVTNQERPLSDGPVGNPGRT